MTSSRERRPAIRRLREVISRDWGFSLLSLLVQIAFLLVGASIFRLCWLLDHMWIAAPAFLLLAAGAWLV
jgi:hypothetical protein